MREVLRVTAARILYGFALAIATGFAIVASVTAWIAQNHVRDQGRVLRDQAQLIQAITDTQDAQGVLSIRLAESQRNVLRSFGSFLDEVAPTRELASR